MRKIIYLVNPISGSMKKDSIKSILEKKSNEHKANYEILPTNSLGNYEYLKHKIEDDGITDVVIVGGDGTVNAVVDALKDTPVHFGIVPMGSGNGLAFCAGIPKNPYKAIDLLFTGTPAYIDGFEMNGHFSCMLSGLGFDAQVAHDFANTSSRGLITYTQQSLFNFFKAHPYQFEIVMNEFSFFTDAFFICVANSNQFGNNFKIAPKASLNDGLLDIVVVQKMNKARLPFAILRQVRGNNRLQELVEDINTKNILYFQVPSLTIRNLKHAPFHVDGEPRETYNEFSIKILKDCFRLIQPG